MKVLIVGGVSMMHLEMATAKANMRDDVQIVHVSSKAEAERLSPLSQREPTIFSRPPQIEFEPVVEFFNPKADYISGKKLPKRKKYK